MNAFGQITKIFFVGGIADNAGCSFNNPAVVVACGINALTDGAPPRQSMYSF
jgi:hypothetical protein